MKAKIGQAMEKWLEEDENLDMWHDSLSGKQRRILMTQWSGEAWRKLSSDKMFAKKLFMKTDKKEYVECFSCKGWYHPECTSIPT